MSTQLLDPLLAEFTTIVDDGARKDEFNLPLSASLPGATKVDEPQTNEYTVPSSVLESVFSTSIDEFGTMQDHTPMFDDLELVLDGTKVNDNEWVDLFPDQPPLPADNVDLLEKEIDFAIREDEVKLTHAAVVAQQQPQKRSHSSAFITPQPTPVLDKPKRARKARIVAADLPPISVDQSDPAAVKRAKNTEAARRSRARKLEKLSVLEDRVDELNTEKVGLQSEVERLKALLVQNGIAF